MRAPEMINHIILEPIDKNHLSMANTTQDSAASQPKWSWGLGRSSTTGSANKETTPLLASQSSQADDDSQRPLAPPPSSAPPPPPTEEVPLKSDGADDTSQSALSQKSKSSKSSSRSKRRKNAPDPTVEAVTAASSHIKNTIKKSIKKKFDGPRKPVLHVLLDIVRLLAGLSSLMMLGMQAVPLFGGLKKGEDSEFSFGLQVAVRIYIMIFCTFFILVESRLPFLKRFFSLNWVLRGFLYSFIGIIGMEQDLAIKVEDFASSQKSSILGPDYVTMFATLFMSLTTWLMISMGIVYMVLGLACMQQLYEKMENEHREKVLEWKRERKMEKDFKRQKDEYRQYEIDRNEGRGEWYDDLPDA